MSSVLSLKEADHIEVRKPEGMSLLRWGVRSASVLFPVLSCMKGMLRYSLAIAGRFVRSTGVRYSSTVKASW